MIDIVVSTDANYLVHTQTLAASIAANNGSDITMHVLAFSLSVEQKEILSASAPFDWQFYDLDDSTISDTLFPGQRLSGDRSLAAYARLLIPNLLPPPTIKKCIYLDVDAVVLDNLHEIYDTDLEGYAIGGVLDANPVERHYKVGLGKEDIYINSGMILWNLEFCRNNDVIGQFKAFIESRDGNVDAMDQGTINGTLSKHIKILPPEANALTAFFQMDAEQIKQFYGVRTYTDAELTKARQHPVFVHYTPNLTTRPWQKNCRHPLRERYWQYRLKASPDFCLTRDSRKTKIKLLSWMFYNLPWAIFLKAVKIR